MSNLHDLFERPIRYKKVRKDVTAFQYRNGNVNIDGITYIFYSMTEAIKRWRQEQKRKKLRLTYASYYKK